MSYLEAIYRDHFENFRSNAGEVDVSLALNDMAVRHADIGHMLMVLRETVLDESRAHRENLEDRLCATINALLALCATLNAPFEIVHDFCRQAERSRKAQ